MEFLDEIKGIYKFVETESDSSDDVSLEGFNHQLQKFVKLLFFNHIC